MTDILETYELGKGISLTLYSWDRLDLQFYVGINTRNKEAGFVTYDLCDNPFDAIFTFIDLGLIKP